MSATIVKIRLSRKALSELSGTGAGQAVLITEHRLARGLTSDERRERGEHPDDMSLMRKIFGPGSPDPRKDGSITVDLTPHEVDGLRLYAETWVMGARDNIDPYYPETLGEYNAASALLRQVSLTLEGNR